MDLLPLNDSRWLELDHRNWSQGKSSRWVAQAPFVPDELSKLCDKPDDLDRFNDLWPWLCSEGTTWPAAFAVVPYAVEFAGRLPPERRFDYLDFVGMVEIYSHADQGDIYEMPSYLIEGYHTAKVQALRLLAETISCHHNAIETRKLLATIAALKGHSSLGETLNHLDCVSGRCPRCGEEVYPEELQQLT